MTFFGVVGISGNRDRMLAGWMSSDLEEVFLCVDICALLWVSGH